MICTGPSGELNDKTSVLGESKACSHERCQIYDGDIFCLFNFQVSLELIAVDTDRLQQSDHNGDAFA